MMVVQIEKPANITLAVWFAELRSWFDQNNCQPILFAEAERITERLLFSLTFADHANARLFADTFSKYVFSNSGCTETIAPPALLLQIF